MDDTVEMIGESPAMKVVRPGNVRDWNGNKSRSAHALGCSLKTLYNKLAQYRRDQQEPIGQAVRA